MKRIISLFLLIVITTLTFASCSSAEKIIKDVAGVRSVNVSKNLFGNVVVSISHFGASGYLVEKMENDVFYIGERPASLDDYMYPERIKIRLFDVDAHKRFESKYEQREVYDYDFGSYKVQFMWNYNSDHGVDIYIASNAPLSVKEQTSTNVPSFGFLRIKVTVDK
jgi:hypothetical protein